MTRRIGPVLAMLVLAAPLFAQQAPATAPKVESNPISNHLRSDLAQSAKNFVAAAEEMPADKYSFQPTPEQMTFAHLVFHTVQANNALCSKISGATAPDAKIADTDGKDKLVAALKASYDYCTTNLAHVDDSNLGDVIPLFGTHTSSRGGTMMIMCAEFADHYSIAAMYLRLSGLLPPTAKK
ncbi:MAG TPA: DinB family protein [Candidatus Acidoferrales bacterium]|nr:DinB family protein [Candidatus Acidoferrales bacterium]